MWITKCISHGWSVGALKLVYMLRASDSFSHAHGSGHYDKLLYYSLLFRFYLNRISLNYCKHILLVYHFLCFRKKYISWGSILCIYERANKNVNRSFCLIGNSTCWCYWSDENVGENREIDMFFFFEKEEYHRPNWYGFTWRKSMTHKLNLMPKSFFDDVASTWEKLNVRMCHICLCKICMCTR